MTKNELLKIAEELDIEEAMMEAMFKGMLDAKQEYMIDPRLPYWNRQRGVGTKEKLLKAIEIVDESEQKLIAAMAYGLFDAHAEYVTNELQNIKIQGGI